jgi:bacterioferritin-associated ferredoxin
MERVFSQDSCEFCPDRVVCHCLNVTEDQIISAIANQDSRTLRDIRRQTSAGDGCTCCHKDVQEIIKRYSLTLVEA